MAAVWPSVRRFEADHLDRISLPVGGIGTGTIGLGGRGDLRDFQIGNRPGIGFRPDPCLTVLWTRSDGATSVRVAEGPVPVAERAGSFGSPAQAAGLPRFASASFEAAYPLGRVTLDDPDVPVRVRVEAFNPFVPSDLAASSWPVMLLRYRLENLRDVPVEAAVSLAMANIVGADGVHDATGDNTNLMREAFSGGEPVTGVTMTASGLPPDHEAAGEITLAVTGDGVSHRLGWPEGGWGASLLDFLEDLAADGALSPRSPVAPRPVASLARRIELGPREERAVTFVIAWRFPNRRAWSNEETGALHLGEYTEDIVGNHYCVEHRDTWRTALGFLERARELEERSAAFTAAVAATSAPDAVRDAALATLTGMRSQTLFRTADGRFFGWEGVGQGAGSCFGSCNHVWNYEFATATLFSELSWSMRETQFALATDARGLMSFRVGLPISRARDWGLAAADGQLGSLVHLYTDWRLSCDRARLARLWPAARRALEFCWSEGGWDADRDGVMEGCQHNTMDVEYYGPNPQMQGWYLAALAACEEMAAELGDPIAADCARLRADGAAFMDRELFTGEYYVQLVRAASDTVAEGLRHPLTRMRDQQRPDYQLGRGCLVDQLVGDNAARLAGLGPIVSTGNARSTWEAVWRLNFRTSLADHVNPMRAFAVGDEAGLLMASYPDGERPERPFPYYPEVMTGFEHTAAAGMALSGLTRQAEAVVDAVRNRHDGNRRSPFDEAECGSHYARAMAAWNTLLAWHGAIHDARDGVLRVTLAEGEQALWATGTAWGTCRRRTGIVTVTVDEGSTRLTRVEVSDRAGALTKIAGPGVAVAGQTFTSAAGG